MPQHQTHQTDNASGSAGKVQYQTTLYYHMSLVPHRAVGEAGGVHTRLDARQARAHQGQRQVQRLACGL